MPSNVISKNWLSTKPYFKWMVGFGLALVVWLTIASSANEKAWRTRASGAYSVTSDPSPAQVEIGGKVFAIPKNYIWSRGAHKGGKMGGINLHALLPGFAPYTNDNFNEFEKAGEQNTIGWLMRQHDILGDKYYSTKMSRELIYERIIRDPVTGKTPSVQQLPGPFGLTQHKLYPPKSRFDDRDLFVGSTQDNNFYWLECKTKESAPSPSCSSYYEYSEHVVVRYNFPRKNLHQWQEIETRLISLIRQFEINATQRK